MQFAPDLDARALGALYDEGYYHGVNSGYPSAGYESEHASWIHWVEHLASSYGPGSRWLDLGCAYGYLVAEAAAGGFTALGLDVSAYALSRASADAPPARGRMTRGFVEALPFPDGAFDVVSAFDVLEHLVDPEAALLEARRVLRHGGVLVGATPDPLFFDRHEATHFSERPPSYWIDRLLALDFAVDFRFFQAPYNLELLAMRGDAKRLLPAARLRCDGFSADADLGTVSGSAAERIALRLRSGWHPAGRDHPPAVRWIGAGLAAAYVLVAGREPARLRAQLEVCAADGGAELTLALDDHQLGRFMLDREWRALDAVAIPVAAGGHHLRLRASAPLFVRRLVVDAEPAPERDLLARLPFDLYQRYDQCRAVLALLAGGGSRLLDVGGVLGGAGGHLATLRDFFPAATSAVSTDVRPSDQPDHRAVSGLQLPFADESFDVVLCQDVLEHLPAADRPALQAELARVSRRFVLLAAPFGTAGVADADALLFELIRARHGYVHAFLAEHVAYGHPDLAATVAYWRDTGASAVVLPNGFLPYWALMQVLNLRLAEPAVGERYATGQTLYNGRVFDWCEPAYRHLLVVDVSGETEWCARVQALAPRAERGRDEARDAPGDAATDTHNTAAKEAQSAAALNQILALAFAALESDASLPPRVADQARAAVAGASPACDTRERRGSLLGGDASDGIDRQIPRAGALPLASVERERLRDLERFADRIWSHPAYRLYGRILRLWRVLRGTRES